MKGKEARGPPQCVSRGTRIRAAVLQDSGEEPRAKQDKKFARVGDEDIEMRTGADPTAEVGMERSFKEEVKALRLGAGETFHGEGILAVTKALLQSGVGYVSGYPGAPISHMVDVLTDAADILDELGVHFAPAANEAGAAAMLGASINYPLRGAVAWKSVVGTNVASDALSNLSSAGVIGGALIIVGEDYGEGASIIQERTHAFAMKSQMWLLDPRPNLPTIVGMVEHGFALSEASRTPVMLELRIRACHVHGSFVCKDNRPPAIRATIRSPRRSSTMRACACRRRPMRRRRTRSTCAGRPRCATRGASAQRGVCRRARATSASSCRAACTTA